MEISMKILDYFKCKINDFEILDDVVSAEKNINEIICYLLVFPNIIRCLSIPELRSLSSIRKNPLFTESVERYKLELSTKEFKDSKSYR